METVNLPLAVMLLTVSGTTPALVSVMVCCRLLVLNDGSELGLMLAFGVDTCS